MAPVHPHGNCMSVVHATGQPIRAQLDQRLRYAGLRRVALRRPGHVHASAASHTPAHRSDAVVAFLVLASLLHENVSLADNRMCPCNWVVLCASHWALRSWHNHWDNPTITAWIFSAIDSFAPPLIRVKVPDESIPMWPRFGKRAHISQHA